MYLGLISAGRLDKFITFSPKNSQANIAALSGRGAASFAATALLSWGQGDKAAFVCSDQEQGTGASPAPGSLWKVTFFTLACTTVQKRHHSFLRFVWVVFFLFLFPFFFLIFFKNYYYFFLLAQIFERASMALINYRYEPLISISSSII